MLFPSSECRYLQLLTGFDRFQYLYTAFQMSCPEFIIVIFRGGRLLQGILSLEVELSDDIKFQHF